MGLKINGSLNGLQSTSMIGAGLFTAQYAVQRPQSDYYQRRFSLPAYASIPHGYSVTGISLAFVAGGMAGRFRGDSVEVAGLSATANASGAFTGSVTIAGSAKAGRGIACDIDGTVTVVAGASALANMAVNVQVNAAPKPIDIAGEILGTLLSSGQTVSESLASIQDVKNTTTAVLGLSV